MAAVTGMGSDYARRHWPEVTWFIHGPGRGKAVMTNPRAYGEMADEVLLAWSAQGDRRAFDEIVTRHGPFALRVATRVITDPLVADFDAVDPAAGTDEMMEANERQAALAGALRALPARQRAAMTLVYDEGLSGAEAARTLGLSAKAVERLLARARTYLRERLLSERGFTETGT